MKEANLTCRDSQGRRADWHACEFCGACHVLDCPGCVKDCEALEIELRHMEAERRAEEAWSQVAR